MIRNTGGAARKRLPRCGTCIRGGLGCINAIRPGANHNTRLRRVRRHCMRIAIFCHKFWPAVGGLCTYTGRLAISSSNTITMCAWSQPEFRRIRRRMNMCRRIFWSGDSTH